MLSGGLLIFITLRRKGKNRLLFVLAWFFIAGGFFRLGLLLPGLVGSVFDSFTAALIVSVLTTSCLYFGLAGYISLQIRYLKGAAAGRMALLVGMILAALLTNFHLLAAGFIPGIPSAVSVQLAPYQIQVMLTVFALSFLFLLAAFGLFFVRARRQGGSFISNSTMNIGLGLLLVSWILQKVVQTEVGSALPMVLAVLPFAAIGIVIAAIFVQTSASMTPGRVSDARSKKPVALAVVRVIRESDKKLLESRVSSDQGRYGILVEPGRYTLDVTAAGYKFPGRGNDGYQGEPLDIKKSMLIGLDIFLDPI